MPTRTNRIWTGIIFLASAAALGHGQTLDEPDQLKQEVERLRAPQVAWRHIPWNPCLLDGLQEAREQEKPALLWVFIDRPADDARC